MKKYIGSMERLKDSLKEIREEEANEKDVDELCEILNENGRTIKTEDQGDEGLVADSSIPEELLHQRQRIETEVSRVH